MILSLTMVSGIKSAELKLIRAAEHLKSIKRCIATYSAGKPHKIAIKPKRKKQLNIPKSPPKRISILAGEMVYQMRSALDHLTFEIIKLNPNISAIDPDWREHCQFPLRLSLPPGKMPPLAETEFIRNLPGISHKAFTVIERMQPYYGNGPANNMLELLANLSNIDKHRHLNLVRPRIRQFQQIAVGGQVVNGKWMMLERGAKIKPADITYYKADGAVKVNRSYTALVAFDERSYLGDSADYPLDILLDLILYHIKVFVIPSLVSLIQQP